MIRRLYPFPPYRFHVLFNSLFKVLCNFPSQYLFAIGLVAILSLRWSLPPTLGCDPKQPDSKARKYRSIISTYRTCTFCGTSVKGTCLRQKIKVYDLYATPQNAWGKTIKRWTFPFSLAVTGGILFSFFCSAFWYALVQRVLSTEFWS